jgi:diguanylate cyclase (GGDEF)-like protein
MRRDSHLRAGESLDTFDAASEVALIAELLIRHAAKLVTSSSQRRVVAGLCEALTQSTPRLVLAWTWFGVDSTRHIVPQIISGPASAYADTLVIDDDALTRKGPAFRALEGQQVKPFQLSESSPYEPWRRAATLHGIRSVLALPLCSTAAGQRGLFVLYSTVPDYFERVGVSLFDALAELIGALLSSASDRTELEAAAHCDLLTGLGNRRVAATAERSMYRCDESAAKSCVLLLDIDHFKEVNDRHGHRAGDQVLREIADHLRALVRADDRVLRWGGEEFLVLVPATPMAQAALAAEKIRAAIESSAYDSGKASVTVSIGVAELGVEMALSAAVEAADTALYAAKRAGRNCVVTA